jgi:hypothetical protein
MKRLVFIALVLLVPGPVAAETRDYSTLYDRATLAREQGRLAGRVTGILERGIRPFLVGTERVALANTTLDFPLVGDNRDPLDFYSDSASRSVTMPVLSLLFLEDLCTAYAWLWANGYRLESVEEYVTMLKYKDFNGRYPPPLAAMQIPTNVLRDPKVSDLSLRFRNTAYAFILGHELGHVLNDDRGYRGVPAEEARRREQRADQFGLEVMRRTRDIPMGAMLFLQTVVYYWPNRADAGGMTDAQWRASLDRKATHPLTAARLKALATRLDELAGDFALGQPNRASAIGTIRFMAGRFSEFADFLADADLQRVMAVKARNSEVSSLAPRREKEILQDFPGVHPVVR